MAEAKNQLCKDFRGKKSFSLLERVEIYKKRIIIPPRKIKTRAFNIQRDTCWCKTNPKVTDEATKSTHSKMGWEMKTLIKKKKKKVEIIVVRGVKQLSFYAASAKLSCNLDFGA